MEPPAAAEPVKKVSESLVREILGTDRITAHEAGRRLGFDPRPLVTYVNDPEWRPGRVLFQRFGASEHNDPTLVASEGV